LSEPEDFGGLAGFVGAAAGAGAAALLPPSDALLLLSDELLPLSEDALLPSDAPPVEEDPLAVDAAGKLAAPSPDFAAAR
jgi:hypothetical protein